MKVKRNVVFGGERHKESERDKAKRWEGKKLN